MSIYDHKVVNGECEDCDARICECGGTVHQEYEDEDWDNVYYRYWCDKCDERFDEYDFLELKEVNKHEPI